jgi:hypothetical protein
MEGIIAITDKKGEVNHMDMQDRIINDIKEFDMDNLKGLIEYLYPVKVSDKEGEEGEVLIVEVNEEEDGLTLEQIF